MRDWRATVIAAVAIPASVVSTFGLMAVLGFAQHRDHARPRLMVGIVIDDAIVVLENIIRFIEEKGRGPFDAAREATAEIALPVLATTLCLVVIFIPVSFMSSISGRFLYQFGITSACAIMVSLLVSFTLTPMMSARMFGRRTPDPRRPRPRRVGLAARLLPRPRRLLRANLALALHHRATVAAVAVLVVASNGALPDGPPGVHPRRRGRGPVRDERGRARGRQPGGNERGDGGDREGGPRRPRRRSGAGDGRRRPLGAVNEGQLFVKIAPHDARIFSLTRLATGLVTLDPLAAFRGNYSQRDVMQQIRQRMRRFGELRVAVRNLQTFNIGGGNFDVDFIIRGPELEALAQYTETLRQKAPELGLQDADTTLKLNKPSCACRSTGRAPPTSASAPRTSPPRCA